jgi:TonB family protein
MSTQNLYYGGGQRLTLFLALSLLIHLGLGWVALNLGPAYSLFSERVTAPSREPIVVEVIELPPWVKGDGRPQKVVTRFADRTVHVDKETVPEKGPIVALRPGGAIRTIPRNKALGKSGPGEAMKGSGKKRGVSARPGYKPGDKTSGAAVLIPEASSPGVLDGGSAEALEGPLVGAPGRGSMGPNLLLTEEQIAALTKRYEAEAPHAEKGKTLRLNTTELRYQKYLMNMKTRIELYWEFPVLAVRNGWQGNLQINFTINEDGTLGGINIANSSGYPVLDDSARTALKLAAPLPPFPENFDIKQIKINAHFEYKINFAPLRN